MENLDILRQEIDKIDEQIVLLYEKRLLICKKIGQIKKENNLPILNKSREMEVIEKNSSLIKAEFKNSYIRLIQLILEESKKMQ